MVANVLFNLIISVGPEKTIALEKIPRDLVVQSWDVIRTTLNKLYSGDIPVRHYNIIRTDDFSVFKQTLETMNNVFSSDTSLLPGKHDEFPKILQRLISIRQHEMCEFDSTYHTALVFLQRCQTEKLHISK